MLKVLLVVLVVVVGLYALLGRSRREPPPVQGKPAARPPPAAMLSCAHCGVHLPRDETVADAAGHVYCGEAHRLAGPR